MRFRECHVAGFAHVVFEVLPRDARGEIFDDEAIVGSDGWSIADGWAAIAIRRVAPLITIPGVLMIASTFITSGLPRTTSKFYPDAFTVQTLPVHLFHGIFRIADILEFHKTKFIFDNDVSDLAESIEEILQIRLAHFRAQSSDEKTRSHLDRRPVMSVLDKVRLTLLLKPLN